ncbi:S-phase kinase-associated protein 1 [Drosophila erecta]|uniref:SKP1 component POZ domain-containing protein n=1 Tax=Drosophila erecta TaxID=7220 RepID=B3NWE0_DROER|nr:S-phase kinase-associated protein 1 [Drosophila erecta]EDV46760.1 uncharacterized protein Dere_GG19259 [Drosophila erecta]
MSVPTIKLQSSDGVIFQTTVQAASLSKTIKTLLEIAAVENDEDDIVPLPNVGSFILDKILAWAHHHKDDPQLTSNDEESQGCSDDISPWDANFMNVDRGTLFELILAANYLEITDLMDLSSKTVANMIRGKSTEQIRQILNIRNERLSGADEWDEDL